MHANDYQQDVLRTESLPQKLTDTGYLELDANTSRALCSVLLEAARSGRLADDMKRHLFYGQGLESKDPDKTDAESKSARLDIFVARQLHSLLGFISESGEIADELLKLLVHEEAPNRYEIAAELGDLAWYLAIGADAIGFPLANVLKANIAKLRVRYKHKFNPAEAAEGARDREAERKAYTEALEGKAEGEQFQLHLCENRIVVSDILPLRQGMIGNKSAMKGKLLTEGYSPAVSKDLKSGDVVIFPQAAGTEVTDANGRELRVLLETDIIGYLEKANTDDTTGT